LKREPRDAEREKEMRCPKCGRFSLKRSERGVTCSFCGRELSLGEEARYHLYELLRR
jgi:ribosomal protein L37AE/L43A